MIDVLVAFCKDETSMANSSPLLVVPSPLSPRPVAKPGEGASKGSEAEPPPAPASAVATDENAVNGLVFFALDAERNLLYVSEQGNHRVRCVLLMGPSTQTS